MKTTYKVGDIVQVNKSAFTPSPVPSDKWIECRVLPGNTVTQIYVAPTKTLGTAMYVFRHHVKGDSNER